MANGGNVFLSGMQQGEQIAQAPFTAYQRRQAIKAQNAQRQQAALQRQQANLEKQQAAREKQQLLSAQIPLIQAQTQGVLEKAEHPTGTPVYAAISTPGGSVVMYNKATGARQGEPFFYGVNPDGTPRTKYQLGTQQQPTLRQTTAPSVRPPVSQQPVSGTAQTAGTPIPTPTVAPAVPPPSPTQLPQSLVSTIGAPTAAPSALPTPTTIAPSRALPTVPTAKVGQPPASMQLETNADLYGGAPSGIQGAAPEAAYPPGYTTSVNPLKGRYQPPEMTVMGPGGEQRTVWGPTRSVVTTAEQREMAIGGLVKQSKALIDAITPYQGPMGGTRLQLDILKSDGYIPVESRAEKTQIQQRLTDYYAWMNNKMEIGGLLARATMGGSPAERTLFTTASNALKGAPEIPYNFPSDLRKAGDTKQFNNIENLARSEVASLHVATDPGAAIASMQQQGQPVSSTVSQIAPKTIKLPAADSKIVRIRAPNGSVYNIPQNKVKAYQNIGGVLLNG